MVQARYAQAPVSSNAKPGTVINLVPTRDFAFSYVDSQGFVRVGFGRVYGKPGQEAVAVVNPDKISETYSEPSPSIKEGILRKLNLLSLADMRPEDLPDGLPGMGALGLAEDV